MTASNRSNRASPRAARLLFIGSRHAGHVLSGAHARSQRSMQAPQKRCMQVDTRRAPRTTPVKREDGGKKGGVGFSDGGAACVFLRRPALPPTKRNSPKHTAHWVSVSRSSRLRVTVLWTCGGWQGERRPACPLTRRPTTVVRPWQPRRPALHLGVACTTHLSPQSAAGAAGAGGGAAASERLARPPGGDGAVAGAILSKAGK